LQHEAQRTVSGLFDLVPVYFVSPAILEG
jgi:hypothetical protein